MSSLCSLLWRNSNTNREFHSKKSVTLEDICFIFLSANMDEQPLNWEPLSPQSVSHFTSRLLQYRNLWAGTLCPRWYSQNSIPASSSIPEWPWRILHLHTADWFICWTHLHTLQLVDVSNPVKLFLIYAPKSYLFQWNRWQRMSRSSNFCSFLLRGRMFAGWRGRESPPSVRASYPLHSLFSTCFYFSSKTF